MCIFRGKLRHPLVTDFEGNQSVGNGYGMARTVDPITLFLLIVKFRKSTHIIDMGCGDGAALAIFQKIKYRQVFGIEADSYLADICKINFPKAKIINQDFIDFSKNSDSSFLFDSNNTLDIYCFNSCEVENLARTLNELKLHNESSLIRLFYRNPIGKNYLSNYFNNSKIIYEKGNYLIMDIN